MSDPILTVSVALPTSLRAPIADKLGRAHAEQLAERLERRDPTLWGPPGTPEIANRLGWLDIAERMLADVPALEAFAAQAHADGLRDVVLLGMGGSSLASEVLRRSFAAAAEIEAGSPALRLHVLDSTDAATVAAVQSAVVDLGSTLFLVSSKSGGTIEPLSMFAHFWSLIPEGANFVAITDPGSGLQQLAERHDFRHVFLADPDIGGRYSALSPFGLVPAALMGIDLRSLLEGSRAAQATHVEDPGGEPQPAWLWLGAALSALAQGGRDKLTFLAPDSLASLGLWLEQLVAESTGKQHTGILPVAEEPLGAPSDYRADRVFVHLPDVSRPDGERERAVQELAAAGHPVVTIPTSGPPDLGRLFLLAELAVAAAGWGLSINPFDQPNVQQAKDATKRVLQQFEANHELPTIPVADDAALHELLAFAGDEQTAIDSEGDRASENAGDPGARKADHHMHQRAPYLAIMGYLQPSEEFDAAVAELRCALRARTGWATTFGYGPRFLHSTGQFHKGGPPVGHFLQLVHDGPSDVEIPGSQYGFTILKHAQALGDLQTLRELGLPAQWVRLTGADPVSALRELTRQIKETP